PRRRGQAPQTAVAVLRRRGHADERQPGVPHGPGGEKSSPRLARRFRRAHLYSLEERTVPAGTLSVPGQGNILGRGDRHGTFVPRRALFGQGKSGKEASMNQKTGKMLTRYASHAGRNVRELKRWWLAMPWTERAEERKRIKRELKAKGGAA